MLILEDLANQISVDRAVNDLSHFDLFPRERPVHVDEGIITEPEEITLAKSALSEAMGYSDECD